MISKTISRWDFNCLFFQDIITLWQLPGHCSMCQAGRLLSIHNYHLYVLHIQMIESASKVASWFICIEYSKQENQQYSSISQVFCQATSGWSQICFLVLTQICEVMACPSDYIWKKTWQPAQQTLQKVNDLYYNSMAIFFASSSHSCINTLYP